MFHVGRGLPAPCSCSHMCSRGTWRASVASPRAAVFSRNFFIGIPIRIRIHSYEYGVVVPIPIRSTPALASTLSFSCESLERSIDPGGDEIAMSCAAFLFVLPCPRLLLSLVWPLCLAGEEAGHRLSGSSFACRSWKRRIMVLSGIANCLDRLEAEALTRRKQFLVPECCKAAATEAADVTWPMESL